MPDGMLASVAVTCAVVSIAACGGGGGRVTKAPEVTVTTITLGPQLATGDSYRPPASSGIAANWTGFCPVPSPGAAAFPVGNAYQIVNSTDRSVGIVVLPNRTVIETIKAGGTGLRNVLYGAVNQPSVTYSYSVAECTDAAAGQGLFTLQVNNK